MNRSPLNSFVTARVLNRIEETHSRHDGPRAEMRNLCAHVPVELADAVDEVVSLLGCRKRQFIETALRDALHHAREVAALEGLGAEAVQSTPSTDGLLDLKPGERK